MNNKKSIFLSIIFIFTTLIVVAQPKDNSPYSRYGLGDPVDNNFVYFRTTGLSGAFYNPYQINVVNPASNGYLRATVFDIGLYAKYAGLKTNSNSTGIYSGNLEYISLGIPLINPINDLLEKKVRKYDIGLTFTLMPASIVGYDVSSDEEREGIGIIRRTYKGTGGTYKFMTGLGGRYNNFSFGFNVGYFFGKINYDREILFPGLNNPYSNNYHTDFSVNGFIYNVGTIYNVVLNKKELKEKENTAVKKLIFGIYGNTKTNFKTKGTVVNTSTIYDVNSPSTTTDTVYSDKNKSGTGTLPVNFGGSIIYNDKDKYIFGVDFSKSLWNQYTNDIKSDNLKDSYKISIGGQYTPDINSYTNYFKRVNYGMGIYYQTDPRSEGDNQFEEKGIHFGMGLPFVFKRKISRINLDLNFGNRGSNLSISENFVKFSLSVTFNDTEWFVKRKYY